MTTSESIKNIIPALLEAQSEMGKAKKGAENPFFHSDYADLPTVMEVVKEPLNKYKIAVVQSVDGDRVRTVLLHESGEWISSEGTPIVSVKVDPQAQGSAITYAKRYDLQALLFVPTVDDDGEKATDHEMKKRIEPNVEWKGNRPSLAQVKGALKVAAYKKDIRGVEEAEALSKEIGSWNAGLVSDYIGNKIDLDEARRLVRESTGE